MSKLRRFKKKEPPKGPLSVGGITVSKSMLTPGQKEAVERIEKWRKTRKSERQQIYRIGAQSGAGKSWLIKYLVDKYGWDRSECYVMSYTGQSVNVLRANGVISSTIHSSIMIPQEEMVLDKETGEPIMKRGIPLTTVKFKPVKYLPPTVKMIIIDEASFLPEHLEDILKGYNVPILEIGDPIQLPPVGGKQVFNMDTLDFFMEGIMRQNVDNEIYQLGTKFRFGEKIYPVDYHKEVQFLHQQETIEETFKRFLPFIKACDVIITSTNKQRQVLTDMYRKYVVQTNSPYPLEGERVICRRNNPSKELGEFFLSNGMQGVCMSDVGRSMIDKSTRTFMMDFRPDVTAGTDLYYDGLICDMDYIKQPFGSNSLTQFKHLGDRFEYAYSITCHLCQGSSYNKVMFFDSFSRDREYLNRLRYTAVTRARHKLYYMIPYKGAWTL